MVSGFWGLFGAGMTFNYQAMNLRDPIPFRAILVAIFVSGASMQANAQVDPNLQSRITTFSPPITVLNSGD